MSGDSGYSYEVPRRKKTKSIICTIPLDGPCRNSISDRLFGISFALMASSEIHKDLIGCEVCSSSVF